MYKEMYVSAAQDLLKNFGHMMTETMKGDLEESIEWAQGLKEEQDMHSEAPMKLVAETIAEICENNKGYSGWWK